MHASLFSVWFFYFRPEWDPKPLLYNFYIFFARSFLNKIWRKRIQKKSHIYFCRISKQKVFFSLSHHVRPNTSPVDQSANFVQRTKLRERKEERKEKKWNWKRRKKASIYFIINNRSGRQDWIQSKAKKGNFLAFFLFLFLAPNNTNYSGSQLLGLQWTNPKVITETEWSH